MTSTPEAAYDETVAAFLASWSQDANPPKVIYDDQTDQIPDDDEWARFSFVHDTPRVPRLGESGGQKLYENSGIVSIQIFTKHGEGLTRNDTLVRLAMNAFESGSTPSGVWFKDVLPRRIGKDGPWFQTNVSARFNYDERK